MIPGRTGVAVEFLASAPDAVVVLFALGTQLADLWFFFVTIAVGYWFGERTGLLARRHAAFLVAVGLAALVAVEGLKHLFALPRPPGATAAPEARLLPAALRPLYRALAVSDGYGFPSGHATAATAIYGAAALVVDYRTRRWRAGAAAVVVALVGFSRVVLGVHYLVDVLAGVVVGSAVLALAAYAGDRGEAPGRVLTLAAGLALVPPVVVFTADTMAALGAALGGRLTWGIVGEAALAGPPGRREATLATVAGLPVAGGLFALGYATDVPAYAFLANALVLAVVIAAPVLARRALG